METPYISKKDGKPKISKKTERVEHNEPFETVLAKFLNLQNEYVIHRNQVANDKFEWIKILETISQYGVIFHSDYSKNIGGVSPKFETQSQHFNKPPYSLHCAVAHETGD